MIGDATLFQRADMVEAGWCVVSPVLDVWRALPPRNFPNHPGGTWGPKEADELLERPGRRRRNFEKRSSPPTLPAAPISSPRSPGQTANLQRRTDAP